MFGGNDTFGGGFDDEPSTPKKGGERIQALVPMLAKHIAKLTDSSESLTFFDRSLNLVRICGILKSQELSSTKATYEVEDFSGTIYVSFWLNHKQDETPITPQVMTGTYVQAVGTLRNQNNRVTLMAICVNSVTNANIPTTHIIEAIHARYMFQYASKFDPSSSAQNMDTSLANNMEMDSNRDMQSKLSPFDYEVLKFIQSNDSTTGCHVDTMKTVLRCAPDKLDKTLVLLNNEGHIYSTSSEFLFKATDLSGL